MTNKHKLIVSAILFVISGAVLAATVKFGYIQFSKNLTDRRDVYSKFDRINQNLAGFEARLRNVSENKQAIQALVAQFESSYMSNQDILSTYRDRVLAAAQAHHVSVSKDEISIDSGATVLTISVETNYMNLYRFIFDIEMFSQVRSVVVAPTGVITIVSTPITYASNIDDYMSGRRRMMDEASQFGYFEEILNRSKELFNTLDPERTHIPSVRDLLPAPNRDPFYFLEEKRVEVAAVRAARAPARPVFPNVNIDGIIFDPENPVVILDGKIQRPGDVIRGARIERITANSVIFMFDGQHRTVRMRREE